MSSRAAPSRIPLERPATFHPQENLTHPAKRRIHNLKSSESDLFDTPSHKRARGPDLNHDVHFLAEPEFFVLKENGILREHPEPVMRHRQNPPSELRPLAAYPSHAERTASGLTIQPHPTYQRCASTELLEDETAALRVRDHMASFRRRFPDSTHERILRSIIKPRASSEGSHPLDNTSLESIFSAANELFFNGRLSQRVTWDWSGAESVQYDSRVIGTTALRRREDRTRGFETLIVLSGPILRDKRYSRRLLISTFMHELIHCYMFICCGFRARSGGGHTKGFRMIAAYIEEWVGEECGLHLTRVEAELDRFEIKGWEETGAGGAATSSGGVLPCSEYFAERGACQGDPRAAVEHGGRPVSAPPLNGHGFSDPRWQEYDKGGQPVFVRPDRYDAYSASGCRKGRCH